MNSLLLPLAFTSLGDLATSLLGDLPLASLDFSKAMVAMVAIGGSFAFCAVELYFKARRQKEVQETIRLLIEKGQPIPPELLAETRNKKPVTPASRGRTDRRIGIITVSIGVGIFATFSAFSGNAQSVRWFAFIPVCAGLAFLLNSWLDAREKPLDPRG